MTGERDERVVMRRSAVEIGLVVGTMLDAPQLDWLYYLARSAPNGPAVEVGVWKGGSIVCWARARRGRGPVHAVDSWYGDAASAVREKFVRNAGVSGLGIDLIDETGHVAAGRFAEGSVAFCFIDACHDDKEDEGIRLDLAAWAPKIMPGGILAFHDYATWKCPAVQTTVDAWHAGAGWEKVGLVGSAIAFRRPVTEENTPDADCTEASL